MDARENIYFNQQLFGTMLSDLLTQLRRRLRQILKHGDRVSDFIRFFNKAKCNSRPYLCVAHNMIAMPPCRKNNGRLALDVPQNSNETQKERKKSHGNGHRPKP